MPDFSVEDSARSKGYFFIAGIDEAGRGPIVGPMVMAGVSASQKNLKKLETLGIKDSKLLTKEKREELYDQIIDIVDAYEIISVSAQEIDEYNFKMYDDMQV